MFKKLISILKEHPRKIVFTEAPTPHSGGLRPPAVRYVPDPILLGNEDEVRAAAEAPASTSGRRHHRPGEV